MQQVQNKTSYNFAQSLRRVALLTTAIAVTMTTMPIAAFAVDPNELPTGGNVVGGNASGTIGQSGNTMNIQQNVQNMWINWNTFNIGQNATVNFNQPNAGAIAMNQVNGQQDPSQILGTMNANGQVWILNPNGVMFGKNAKVDVAGLLASTGHIDEDNFVANGGSINSIQLTNMNPNASVVNNGSITVKEGGLVALVGAQVANNGVINAKLGKVILGGAETATLDFTGDGLLTIEAPSQLVKGNVVSNSGVINAEGGVVQMTAEAAKYSIDNVINMDGVIMAKGGKVKLHAGYKGKANIKIGGDTDSLSQARAGRGKIDVSSDNGKGGDIEISGGYIDLQKGSILNANGYTGGGNVTLSSYMIESPINGAKVQRGINFGPKAQITADATNSGSGGQIYLSSMSTITSSGNFFARGFDGAGQVWLEGLAGIKYTGFADLSNWNAGGAAGTLRLSSWNPIDVGSTITGDLLSKQLGYANVTLSSMNILFNDVVQYAGNNLLTLQSTGMGMGICMIGGGCTFWNEPGHIAFNSNFAVNNVEFNSYSHINVDGSKVRDFRARNVNLNTYLNFSQQPKAANAPDKITVGKWGGSEGVIQQAFSWVKNGGTVLLNGVFNQSAIANKAMNFGGTAGSSMDNLVINDNGFNILTDGSGETQVQAKTVTLNANNAANHLLQNAYNMIKNSAGTLFLTLASYADSLNHTSSGANVVGLRLTPVRINDLTLTAVGGDLLNIRGNTVRENSGSDAQRALNLTVTGGNTIFNFANYAEAINVNRNLNLSSSVGGTLFNQIDINNSNASFASILGNTVNANVGTAQNSYNITNTGGTLNLGQNSYGSLFANKANVTVNGTAGGSQFGNITLAAFGNVFNNVGAPTVYVMLAGLGQQGINLVNDLGNVFFMYANSGETLTLDRNITLNGLSGEGGSSTTVGTLNINTMLGNINNLFGNTVNLNTTDDPMRGINATATGGNLFLSMDSYFPKILTTTRFMHIWGTPAFSLFAGANNVGGAILHRIRFPGVGGPGDVNNTNPPITDELLNANGAQTLEALLSALSPAGPGDEEGIKLCTAKDAGAAAECIADAMESGKTVVMFDITNNKFAVVEENATGQKIEWRPVSQEEIEKLLGRSLDI